MTMEIAKPTKLDWKKLIEEQEKSGLSQAAYCKQHGFNLAKLGYHRGRLKIKQIKQSTSNNNPEFKPVKITSAVSATEEIKITLPNGFQCTLSSQVDILKVKKLIEVLLSC